MSQSGLRGVYLLLIDYTGRFFHAGKSAISVETMQARLESGRGRRPGRPTDANWVLHPEVPMSDVTRKRLAMLAEQSSTEGRKVSLMQIAARILEEALASLPEH